MPYISEFLCSKLKGLLRKNERGSRLKPKNLRRWIINIKHLSDQRCNARKVNCGRVFTLPPRDSTLQHKRCVHFWNNFPCITSLYLIFLSREIDKKNCVKCIRKFIYMQFCIKVVVLNRSYSRNTQPIWKQRYPTGAWESQVCSYYNFLFCILHF